MWSFKGKVALCLIKYHTINTHIELSLKQTQCPQIRLTPTAANGEFVGWTVCCMNRGILQTVRDWAVGLRKKLKKKNIYSSNIVVHEIILYFILYLPALFHNCFLTPAVTKDVYKQYTTACPLLPAATIRRVLFVNFVINFI